MRMTEGFKSIHPVHQVMFVLTNQSVISPTCNTMFHFLLKHFGSMSILLLAEWFISTCFTKRGSLCTL